MAKKKFAIPVTWRMSGTYNIDADNLMQAIEIARRSSDPLPGEGSYISDSYEVEELAACLTANNIPADVSDMKPDEILEELNLRAQEKEGKNSIWLAGFSDKELVECLSVIYGIKASQ